MLHGDQTFYRVTNSPTYEDSGFPPISVFHKLLAAYRLKAVALIFLYWLSSRLTGEQTTMATSPLNWNGSHKSLVFVKEKMEPHSLVE